MASKKLWAGRTSGETNQIADDFNSSIKFDKRMYRQDILGSIAHASMLGKTGIISDEDALTLIDGLNEILSDIDTGNLVIDDNAEDIHMFVETVLTERIGEVGKKLHTARSRNDQVALDLRLYLKDEIKEIKSLVKALAESIIDVAEKEYDTVMPGYTHLQRAQPITFGHHLLAYAEMLIRDITRLIDTNSRMDVSPIGSCALAGTTFPTDRRFEADLLGFSEVSGNSVDGVSDRDFVVELLSDLSILMMHLSRLSEEIILWTSWEFSYVTLSDSFTTGSSIMPQKKNSDMAELIRGKTGRVYGDLLSLLTALKGLPLAYNKDMQEDKEAVFDAVDTVKMCVPVMTGMISTMTVNRDNMAVAAQKGFINATDFADYLVNKGVSFRDAYKISGEVVAECIRSGRVLETLSLDAYRRFSGTVEDDVYEAVNLNNCVNKRNSQGGTSPESVKSQIMLLRVKMKGF